MSVNRRRDLTQSIVDRFRGSENKVRLIETLKNQITINGDTAVATLIAQAAELRELAPGTILIAEGATDTDIYFVLSGRVSVAVRGTRIAERQAGEHVGEMGLIDPTVARSAQLTAIETTVVAKLSESSFVSIADQHPHVWRRLSVELAKRLRQRNALIRQRNDQPVLFIGSSAESVGIAHAIEAGLSHDQVNVDVWTHGGVFNASSFPMEALEARLGMADFAVLVCGPDDVVVSKHKRKFAPRDNVVFELGLFMGAIERRRTYIVKPRGMDLKLPTDVLGMTPLEYRPEPAGDLAKQTNPICTELRRLMHNFGPR